MPTSISQKSGGKYSRAGCFSCKFRKKKCDERKPVCQACERNVLLCSWPEKAEVRRKSGGRVTTTHEVAALKPEEPPSVSHPDRLSLPQVSSGRRQEMAIITSTTFILSPTFGQIDLQGSSAVLHHRVSHTLYEHYVQRLGKWCSSYEGPDNPWLARLVPLALSNDLIMQALLSYSGAHYPNRSPSISEITWTHHALAIRGLKFGLTNFQTSGGKADDALSLLLTSLLLFTAEFQAGKVQLDSFHHLKAIRAFLNPALGMIQRDRVIGRFLIEFYTYISVLADFSMTAFSDEWRYQDTDPIFPTWLSEMLCAGPHSLLVLIPAVSAFANGLLLERGKSKESGGIYQQYSPSTIDYYLSLQCDILRWWVPPETIDIAVGQIYQQALLLSLEISFRQHSTENMNLTAFVRSSIERMKQLLRLIPLDSPLNTTLCWPLVVMGFCAKSTEDQLHVQQRLEDMYERLLFRNILEARDFLQISWANTCSEENRGLRGPVHIQNEIVKQKRRTMFV